MINTTDRPLVLLDGSRLDKAIRRAISWTGSLLRTQLENTKLGRDRREAFLDFLGEANRQSFVFNARFIDAAFDFISTDSRNNDSQRHMAVLAAFTVKRTAAASNFPQLKRGLKLTLVELWRQRAVLLPTVFTPGPGFTADVFDHELLRWVLSFDPSSDEGRGKVDHWRLHHYGPRLLFTTDWRKVEDVDLNDIARLHLAKLKHANGTHTHAISGSPFPWSLLPAELFKRFPDRVKFGHADIARYSAWIAKRPESRGALSAFDEPEPTAPRARKPTPYVPTQHNLSGDAEQAKTHEGVLAYCKRLARRSKALDWRTQVPSYPGREHIDVGSMCKKWIESFKAYLHHREQILGYRDSYSVTSSLNILGDYLFAYLPWWREMYSDGTVTIPNAPKDFSRFAFVVRHSDEPLNLLPMPFLQFVLLRRPNSASRTILVKHLSLYFRFVGAHYGDDEEMAGPRYKIPMDDEFDAPRATGIKSKTNKVVIQNEIFWPLLFYCYAVEEFGLYLLQLALDGRLENQHAVTRTLRFDTALYGMSPTVRYRGSENTLHQVPNVFTWVERELIREGEKVLVMVPHLSALRVLIVALETGLRLQSVQWLDDRTWDKKNNGIEDKYVYQLFINTDKTKPMPWVGAIVYRVRRVLQREADFQRLFTDFGALDPVPYEGQVTSPFGLISPLFRSPKSGKPVGDVCYAEAWLQLQVDFEFHYREATGEQRLRMFYIRAKRSLDGEPVIGYEGRNSAPYCELSILAVHTPHSTRATFATNRQFQGILGLEDCAELLGHAGVVTTAHYTKFSSEQIEERLRLSDLAMVGDYTMFDVGAGSPYPRADTSDSALVQSVSKNRVAAIDNFAFMPSLVLSSIEHEKLAKHDGLALLKSQPLSRIRFRETHICPVDENCPDDIVRLIGGPRRCGGCPLTVKSVDHLPAIAAKSNELIERIRFRQELIKRMESAGEPAASVDAVWEEVQIDVNELLGWKFSTDVLHGMLAEIHHNTASAETFHVERPDMVRHHLQRVTRDSDHAEFLLQRIAESNAYPSMTSPQVQIAAAALRRRLTTGQGLDELVSVTQPDDEVRAVATMLGLMMRSKGLTVKALAALLSSPDAPESNLAFLLVPGADHR